MDATKWVDRFMGLAHHIATWSSCIREGRQVGAVIVKEGQIISTGYNGAPSRVESCKEKGFCIRDELHIESGTRHEICQAAHAEQNAIVQAAKHGVSVKDGILYCTHQPCSICMKIIINAGIKEVVYDQGYPDDATITLAEEAGVHISQIDDLKKQIEAYYPILEKMNEVVKVMTY
ncbi:MAG: dCMP deaminase family protein [Clostridia bacterium]|nr:dCMP deaminase family protein [Clostridia bacterium]